MPLWLYYIVKFVGGFVALPIVAVYAIRGQYPWWLITPDDQESPFGSYEPTVRRIYERWGRYVGDVYWLGRRNTLYGLAYRMKPTWLKDAGLKYIDLRIWQDGDTIYLRQPDGTLLRERTVKLGFFYLIVGHRLGPIWNAHREELDRVRAGQPLIGRPLRHPNMDGRPILTLRTKRTL